MAAALMPDLRVALTSNARASDVALYRYRVKRHAWVRVAVTLEAQELQPLKRFVPDDVGIPQVMYMMPASHPAPLTRPARARDHAAPLRLPCVPIFASCHG